MDMASGHEPTFYTLVMNNSSQGIVDNGDRPGATTRRFLQEHSSYRSVIYHRARVDLSVHEYVLSFYKATPSGTQVSGQGLSQVKRRAGGFSHYAIRKPKKFSTY